MKHSKNRIPGTQDAGVALLKPSDFLARRDASKLGVYFHFPYCLQKCDYCDFYSLPKPDSWAEALAAYERDLEQELRFRTEGEAFRDFVEVNTVFFGGGTPSLMPPDILDRCLGLLRERFVMRQDCEISLEANPEQLTAEYMAGLARVGVNRLSIGVQSIREPHLKTVHRLYDAEKYQALPDLIAQSPFENVNIDLIYGFPGQTKEAFFDELSTVASYGATHLSLYALTAESGTPYHRKAMAEGSDAEDEMQASVLRELPDAARRHGFFMYEVSNFARPGFECRHNLRYWLYEPYLGIGPGAHGFSPRGRYSNPRSIQKWKGGMAGTTLEKNDPILELPLSILRITGPLSVDSLCLILGEHLGVSVESAVRSLLLRWQENGFCRLENSIFQWEKPGLIFLDDRIAEFSATLDKAIGHCSASR